MSEEQVVKRIMESKTEQQLRDHLNSGKSAESFKDGSDVRDKVVDSYNQKDESAKQQFTQKGWKNG